MPVYEQVYKPWRGSADSRVPAWFVIGKTGVRLQWKKSMILMLILASVTFFFRTGQIYMASRFGPGLEILGESGLLDVGPGFFFEFISGQMFFLILVSILSGSGIVANDRRSKALPLYFSKPLGFYDYLAGKFFVVAFYGSLVTFVPAMLLFLMKVLLASDLTFVRSYYWLPLAVTGYSMMVLVVTGGVVLAVSASARGARSAAIVFFVLMSFPELLRVILGRIPLAGIISIQADMQQAGAVLFGETAPHSFPSVIAVIFLALAVLLSFLVLRKRIRPTEVVT